MYVGAFWMDSAHVRGRSGFFLAPRWAWTDPRPHDVRGTQKQSMDIMDLGLYLINFRGTNQPHRFLFIDFFLAFLAFLGKMSSKAPKCISH
jgi:hypothetical protein